MQKSLDEFVFLPDLTTDYGVAALERLKINVSTCSQLLLIGSFLNLQITRKYIISWMSTKFSQIRQQTTV